MALSLQLNILIVVCVSAVTVASLCEVRVPGRAWPTPSILIPVNSTILIYCTTNQSSPYWSIDLAAADVGPKSFTDVGDQITFLNENGLYELPQVNIEGEPSTLRLLINDTEMNNQTVVKCVGGDRDILETTLFVYEPSLVTLEATDSETMQSSNISWSFLPSLVDPEPKQTYSLSVKSPSTQELTFQLYEPYYLFTAPEGAPPCEIYDFSVIATYVGATYTGAGCSVPSPVISRMLPSLPDIDLLEASINYSLKKQSGKVILSVSYQPAKFCEEYPMDSYTLVVESVVSALPPESQQFTSSENSIVVHDLSQDSIYTFVVYAQNSVGNMSTQGREIYTTDVQSVQVTEMEGKDKIRIQCDFMVGSDARGCMVELMGTVDNTTVNLTRKSDDREAVSLYELPYPLSCYHQAFGLDIESDRSPGSLSVPVTLMREVTPTAANKCSPNEEAPLQRRSTLITGILIPIIVLLAAVFAVGVTVIVLQLKLKYSSQFSPSDVSFPTSLQDQKTEEGIPLYAVPDKLKKHSNGTNGVRSTGDGAEQECTHQESSMTINTEECENVTSKTDSSQDEVQQQNSLLDVMTDMGGVLRGISPDPDAPPLPPPYNPDSAEPAPHPIYDEIHSTKVPPSQPREGVTYDCITLESPQNPPIPTPIYQDISELPPRTPVQQRDVGEHCSLDNSGPPKPLPVYQDIADICRGPPAPGSSSNGNSNTIELHSVLQMESAFLTNASPPLPPRCPRIQNGELPVRIRIEPDESTGTYTDNPGPSPSPETLTSHHPKTLPIYNDISEVTGADKSNGTLAQSELSLIVESDSTNSETVYTPEPLPTPIYEDIDEATNGVRGGASSPVHVHSPSPQLDEHLTLQQSTEEGEEDDDNGLIEGHPILPGGHPIPSGGTLV